MLKQQVADALTAALESLELDVDVEVDGSQVSVSASEVPEFGDFTSNVAFRLSGPLGVPPREVARQILSRVDQAPFARVEVAGAGFLNFHLKPQTIQEALAQILRQGGDFGTLTLGAGRRVQVEYGSANPTGPLHIGFARNVVLGDVLANLLEAAGYEVQREYYVNDTGAQVRLFAESLFARYAQALGHEVPLPEGGYRGAYLIELGREAAQAFGRRLYDYDGEGPREEALATLRRWGLERVLRGIRQDLERLGVRYDEWFSEEEGLHRTGLIRRTIERLRKRGYVAEREGAVWFLATKLGAPKDEVLIKSDGSPGYFAADVAYAYDKLVERGFDRAIYIWGADHQGQAQRLRLAVRALDLDPDRVVLLLYQLVTFKRGGQDVRLSKRAGDLVLLSEVVDEVGPDAVRYFLAARSPDSQMDFDLELATRQSKDNPVYYIQYAHTRIAGILREGGLDPEADGAPQPEDLSPLREPEELDLIKRLDAYPEVLREAVEQLSPHFVAAYAHRLAASFHTFYERHRVLAAEEDLRRARLALARATQLVLRKALTLLGVSAPERM